MFKNVALVTYQKINPSVATGLREATLIILQQGRLYKESDL